MTYSTAAELKLLTGSTLADANCTAIIEAGDRKIDAYLSPYGLGGAASGACKEASLEMGKAGLLEEGLQSGKYQATSGDFTSSVDVIKAIEHHQKSAFKLLDLYVVAQSSLASSKRAFVRRVDGRC